MSLLVEDIVTTSRTVHSTQLALGRVPEELPIRPLTRRHSRPAQIKLFRDCTKLVLKI